MFLNTPKYSNVLWKDGYDETSESQCQYHHLPADFEKDNDLMYRTFQTYKMGLIFFCPNFQPKLLKPKLEGFIEKLN